MKTITKTKVTKTVEEEIETVTCDTCGKKASIKGYGDGIDWSAGNPEVLETAVYIKTGNCYRDGGSGEITELHICPKCFNKLLPLLQTLPLKNPIKATEWDT